MNNYIEYDNVEELVKNSEITKKDVKPRSFQYELNQKQAKAKLIKGAKRNAFDVENKSNSINLIFNLGSWSNVVLPSIIYWNQIKDEGACKIGSSIIRVASVRSGIEAGGNHVDTQIVFFSNRDKVTCHFYNTTQLILINGHGYSKFVEEFLKPYFLSKITKNIEDIEEYNEKALESLSGKKVKRASVRYKGGSTFPCNRCEFAAKTLTSLAKHSRNEHVLNSSDSSAFLSHPLPTQSTRNNSLILVESENPPAIENKSKQVENDSKDKLKYTCIGCEFKTTNKSNMDKHVVAVHEPTLREADIVCGVCSHKFLEEADYNIHLKTHESITPMLKIRCGACDTSFIEEGAFKSHLQSHEVEDSPSKSNILINEDVSIENILDGDNYDINNKDTPSLEEMAEASNFKCSNCAYMFDSEVDLKSHEETTHVGINTTNRRIINVDISTIDATKSTEPEDVPGGVICSLCKLQTKNFDTLREHIENIHIRELTDIKNGQDNIFVRSSELCTKCQKCPFIGSERELKEHQEVKHKENFTCQICGSTFISESRLRDHVEVEHVHSKKVEPVPCEVCGLFFSDLNLLQKHVETFHKVEGVKCYECKSTLAGPEELQTHIIDEHPEIALFHTMAQQLFQLHSMFEGFGISLNAIKQELFLIRNYQKTPVEVTQHQPQTTPTPSPSPTPTTPSSALPPSEKIIQQVESGNERARVSFSEALKREKKGKSTKSSGQKETPSPSCSSPSSPPRTRPFSSVPESVIQVEEENPKVLFVGDSISSCVNLRELENVLDKPVISAKAYSSVYDEEQNTAKQATRFPRANYKDVISAQLCKSN